ncbi:MAG: hypothetical protein ACI9B7_001285 [Oleispira sp.]|jgi:hypothetical protein
MTYKDLPLEMRLKFFEEINPNGKQIIGVEPIKYDNHFEYQFGEDWKGFMNALDINRSELFQTNNSNISPKLLFRGHKEKGYKLLPSAFRNLDINTIRILKSGNGNGLIESDDFINFIEGMNAIGLHIEPESFEYINQLSDDKNRYSFDKYGDYAHGNMVKDLALAQHYGVPTRLLDFTLNPLVALFFATQGITTGPQSKENIGIWVIPEKLIEVVNENKFVERIFVNDFQNRNMVAQKAMFINYIKNRGTEPNLYADDKIKTLDQYLLSDLSNDQRQIVDKRIGKPMLFTLSHFCEREITKYLDLININWTTIQPDLDGVKKEVERRKRKRLLY